MASVPEGVKDVPLQPASAQRTESSPMANGIRSDLRSRRNANREPAKEWTRQKNASMSKLRTLLNRVNERKGGMSC